MLNDPSRKFALLLHFKLIFDLLFNADLGMILMIKMDETV